VYGLNTQRPTLKFGATSLPVRQRKEVQEVLRHLNFTSWIRGKFCILLWGMRKRLEQLTGNSRSARQELTPVKPRSSDVVLAPGVGNCQNVSVSSKSLTRVASKVVIVKVCQGGSVQCGREGYACYPPWRRQFAAAVVVQASRHDVQQMLVRCLWKISPFSLAHLDRLLRRNLSERMR